MSYGVIDGTLKNKKTVACVDVTNRAIWAWLRHEDLGFGRLMLHYT